MLKPTATWNPARGVWETTQENICGHSAPYSQTWPTSGMTRGGSAFVLVTSVRAMIASACSSSPFLRALSRISRASSPRLLATPNTQDSDHYPDNRQNRIDQRHQLQLAHVVPLPTPDAYKRGGPSDPVKRRAGGHQASIADVLTHLPTPTASGSDANLTRSPTSGQTLGQALGMWGDENRARPKLLPTPAVNDMGAGKTPDEWTAWNDGPTMAHQKHGPSLAVEATKLLPTPKATNNENRTTWDPAAGNLGSAVNTAAGLPPKVRSRGASTAQPSSDGPGSSAEKPRRRRSPARRQTTKA